MLSGLQKHLVACSETIFFSYLHHKAVKKSMNADEISAKLLLFSHYSVKVNLFLFCVYSEEIFIKL